MSGRVPLLARLRKAVLALAAPLALAVAGLGAAALVERGRSVAIRPLPAAGAAIQAVALSADGAMAAIAGANGSLRLMRADRPLEPPRALAHSDGPVTSLAIVGEGATARLVYATALGQLRVREAATGAEIPVDQSLASLTPGVLGFDAAENVLIYAGDDAAGPFMARLDLSSFAPTRLPLPTFIAPATAGEPGLDLPLVAIRAEQRLAQPIDVNSGAEFRFFFDDGAQKSEHVGLLRDGAWALIDTVAIPAFAANCADSSGDITRAAARIGPRLYDVRASGALCIGADQPQDRARYQLADRVTSAAIDGGAAVLGEANGHVRIVDLASRRILARYRIGAGAVTQIAIAGGRAVVGTDAGAAAVISLSPAASAPFGAAPAYLAVTGEKLARWWTATLDSIAPPQQTQEPTLIEPAVTDTPEEPPQQGPPPETSREQTPLRMPAAPNVAGATDQFMIFFGWDRANVTPEAAAVIDEALKRIPAEQLTRVVVVGHTDTSNGAAYSQQLSARMAAAVAQALVARGVRPAVIEQFARGEADLLVRTGDGVREPQNRRVDVSLFAARQERGGANQGLDMSRLDANDQRIAASFVGNQARIDAQDADLFFLLLGIGKESGANTRGINLNRDRYVQALWAARNDLRQIGISNRLRLAHFVAQGFVESAQFRAATENLNYSASRLQSTYRRQFPDENTAAAYAGQPEKIANLVYANRLGNGDEASGDGWRFRGRGFYQIAGRNNYRLLGERAGVDLVNDPEALERDLRLSVIIAAHLFMNVRAERLADSNDASKVSRAISRGNPNSGSPAMNEDMRIAVTARFLKYMESSK